MSPPHSRLSRRYLLHFRLPALPLCPLASTPEPVPPLSPPYYLHITSTFPSVPPLSPPLQYVPRRAVASIHSRLSRRCLLTFPSVRSAPVAHPSTPSLSVVPMSPPSTPACPDAVVTTVCLAAAALSPPHRCRLHSRLSRAAVARPPVSCQTDAVSSERRAEARPPVCCQTDAVTAERHAKARPTQAAADRCGLGTQSAEARPPVSCRTDAVW